MSYTHSHSMYKLTNAIQYKAKMKNKGCKLDNIVSIANHEYVTTINACKDYKYLETSVCMTLFISRFSYQIRVVRVV